MMPGELPRPFLLGWLLPSLLAVGACGLQSTGEADSGPIVGEIDAGFPIDAGLDGGFSDAGEDGGPLTDAGPMDAGGDAGFDAGAIVDGGLDAGCLAAGCPLYDNWFDGTITFDTSGGGGPLPPVNGETVSFLVSFPTPVWGPLSDGGQCSGALGASWGASSWTSSYQVAFSGGDSNLIDDWLYRGGLWIAFDCGSVDVASVGLAGTRNFTLSGACPFDGGLTDGPCGQGRGALHHVYLDPQHLGPYLPGTATFESHAADDAG